MSGATWDECSTYCLTNSLEVANWRQQKDKIIITLKGTPSVPGVPKAEKVPGEGPTNDDAKTKLNQFCQKKCRKVITKTDVVYNCDQVQSDVGISYQASVTLNCLEAISFAGAVCGDKKTAEKSAAQEALTHFADEVDTILDQPAAKKQKKEKSETDKTPSVFGAGAGKSELNMALAKILKRPLSKQDAVYETEKIEGVGFQSTLKLPNLPEEWASKSWAGEAMAKKTDAEHSAAQIAAEDIKPLHTTA